MSLNFSFGLGYVPRFTATTLNSTVETTSISVKVYPLFYKKTIVEWSIPTSWGDCSFNLYKSETEEGDWVKINSTPIINSNFFEDSTTKAVSKFHHMFYKVEVRMPAPDNRYVKSKPFTWEHKRSSLMEIRAREITRRESILLDKFVGIDSLVFRKKYFGKRCPNCYNAAIEKVTKDNCSTCLGTSFLGGYFVGMPTKMCYEISPNNTQLSYQGKVESNSTTAWTISSPELMTHDLILRATDAKLFRIEAINQTELQTVQVRQLVQIIELSKDSIEMNLINDILPEKYKLLTLQSNTSLSTTGYIL